jgi:hypothetical protein
MPFANIEGKCYCCGKGGHKSPMCRLKDKITKEEWDINKAKSNEHSHMTTEQAKSETSSLESKGWSGAHIQFQFYQSVNQER